MQLMEGDMQASEAVTVVKLYLTLLQFCEIMFGTPLLETLFNKISKSMQVFLMETSPQKN